VAVSLRSRRHGVGGDVRAGCHGGAGGRGGTGGRAEALPLGAVARHVPPPVRVAVPSVGVASSVLRLGRNADGTIEVPGDWERAGWYRRGPRPGQVGPAVILGHVDSTSGPAVFFRLDELAPATRCTSTAPTAPS